MTQALREINLLQGVTAKSLVLPVMKFDVEVEIDPMLSNLIKEGKEGLRWQTLQDAAGKAAEPIKKILKEEIAKFDAKIPTLPGDEMKKAAEVLTHTLKQVCEAQKGAIQAAVDKEWAAAVRRSKTLSKFKWKTLTKLVMGSIAIAASIVSVALTGGAAILAAVAILKAGGEMAITFSNYCEDIDDAADDLAANLKETRLDIDKQIKSRAIHVISDLSPIIGACMNTIKTCDQDQIKLEAKVGEAEGKADDVVGKLNQGLDKLRSVKPANPKQEKFIQELEKANENLLEAIIKAHAEIAYYIKINESAREEIGAWKAKRVSDTVTAIKASSIGKIAVAIGTVARLALKLGGLPVP